MHNTPLENLRFQITFCETNIRYLLGETNPDKEKILRMENEVEKLKARLLTLTTLSEWGKIAHDDNSNFVEKFCPHASLLTQVTWDSENMRFVYILKSGQHVADSVKISEWLDFISIKN